MDPSDRTDASPVARKGAAGGGLARHDAERSDALAAGLAQASGAGGQSATGRGVLGRGRARLQENSRRLRERLPSHWYPRADGYSRHFLLRSPMLLLSCFRLQLLSQSVHCAMCAASTAASTAASAPAPLRAP